MNAALASDATFLSQTVIKALNYHAIACLHDYAGQYRPHPVKVEKPGGTPNFVPPEPFRVATLMDDFLNRVNLLWYRAEPVTLGAFVLWRLNWIHPFVNGNGRTARAACYFVICVKQGTWLAGNPILPELLRVHRERYVAALEAADRSGGLGPLTTLLMELLVKQLQSVGTPK